LGWVEAISRVRGGSDCRRFGRRSGSVKFGTHGQNKGLTAGLEDRAPSGMGN